MPAARDPLEKVQEKLRAFDRIVAIVEGLKPKRVRKPKATEPDEPPQAKLSRSKVRRLAAQRGDDPPEE